MQKIPENVFPFSEKIPESKKVAPLSLKRPFFHFFFWSFFWSFFRLWCHFLFLKKRDIVIVMLYVFTESQKKDLKKGPKRPKRTKKGLKNKIYGIV